MANPMSAVLQLMNQKTVTLGWDVVVAYTASAVNDLFAQQYVANVRGQQYLPPINGTLDLAAGVTVQLVNLTLGPPLISFAPSVTNQQAIVVMSFIAGEIVVTEQNGSISYVSAYQAIVPGDNYALSMIVQLQQAQGDVSSQNLVVVNLQNASTFTANLLPGTAAGSLLGTYFQSIFQKETQGTLTYELGTIVTGSDENLTPVTFDIRTQVYPGTQGPDGAVLLFVATTYNPSGGNLPGASFPYLIPDGSSCALVVASRTLFANIFQSFYQGVLYGNPTFALDTFTGTSPASYLQFTGGALSAGAVSGGWYSGGGVSHSVWSGTPGNWAIGNKNKQPVQVPYNGLTVQPENDLLSLRWSNNFGQDFAATTCAPRAGCTASEDSVTLTISGSFTVSPTVANNNVSFAGGSPSVSVSFQSSGWFSKWFGNGNIRDTAASQISAAAKAPAAQVLQVPLPQVNTFAVSHLLFPSQNALQYADAYLPGDLALFGAIQPQQTAFNLTPLQATIAGGETQQFTASNGQAATWTINPRIGTISASGLYTAPASITTATPIVVTATQGQNLATSVVVLVPSPVAVSSAYSVVSPNGGTIQLEASVLGGLGAATWTLSPSDGTAGTISAAGLYTPPGSFTPGVLLATATASAGGHSASSLLCLVDAVFAFAFSPNYALLTPNGTQQFTVAGSSLQWSLLTPGLGTITQTGLYTAPAVIPQPATAVLMVQMTSDTNLIGLGIVMLTPSSS